MAKPRRWATKTEKAQATATANLPCLNRSLNPPQRALEPVLKKVLECWSLKALLAERRTVLLQGRALVLVGVTWSSPAQTQVLL